MLIAGYYDASQTADDGQPILAVAGFVSSNLQWHYDFCAAWQRVLEQQGLEYFHMTDYETRQPPYADWDEERRKAVLTELLAIIARSVVFGAGAAVFLNDYNALSPDDRKVLGTPYHLCALWCGRLTKEQLDQDKRQEDVAFVFEAGDVGHGEVRAGLNAASEIDGTHVLSVTFKDKRDYPQLQAADIFAYETAKQTLRVAGRGSRTNLRKSAEILLNSGVGYRVEYCDAASLATLVQRLRAHGATKAGMAPASQQK